jgi:hypothetical protein
MLGTTTSFKIDLRAQWRLSPAMYASCYPRIHQHSPWSTLDAQRSLLTTHSHVMRNITYSYSLRTYLTRYCNLCLHFQNPLLLATAHTCMASMICLNKKWYVRVLLTALYWSAVKPVALCMCLLRDDLLLLLWRAALKLLLPWPLNELCRLLIRCSVLSCSSLLSECSGSPAINYCQQWTVVATSLVVVIVCSCVRSA